MDRNALQNNLFQDMDSTGAQYLFIVVDPATSSAEMRTSFLGQEFIETGQPDLLSQFFKYCQSYLFSSTAELVEDETYLNSYADDLVKSDGEMKLFESNDIQHNMETDEILPSNGEKVQVDRLISVEPDTKTCLGFGNQDRSEQRNVDSLHGSESIMSKIDAKNGNVLMKSTPLSKVKFKYDLNSKKLTFLKSSGTLNSTCGGKTEVGKVSKNRSNLNRPLRKAERNTSGEGREKAYVCYMCGKEFRWANSFKSHCVRHFSFFQCFMCEVRLCGDLWDSHYKSHMRKLSRRKQLPKSIVVYLCEHCPKKYESEKMFRKHIWSNHEKSQCYHCGHFVTNKEMTVHMLKHRKTYPCTICPKEFRSPKTLERHLKAHQNCDVVECQYCGRHLFRYKLRDHLLRHEGRTIPCPVCSKLFSCSQDVTIHLRKIHTDSKRFSCDVCGKKFYKKGMIARHMLTHTGERPYECSECGKRFQTYFRLKVHCSLVHNQTFSFKCEWCRIQLPSVDHLSRHREACQRRPGARLKEEFECDVCNKVFTQRYKLTNHMVAHDRSRKCEWCRIQLPSVDHLSRHREACQRRPGARLKEEFECDVCKKVFTLRYKLNNHMVAHDRSRYACSSCPKRFKHFQNLIQHDRKKHNIEMQSQGLVN